MNLLKLSSALIITTLFFGFIAMIFIVGSWFFAVGQYIIHNMATAQLILGAMVFLFCFITWAIYLLLKD